MGSKLGKQFSLCSFKGRIFFLFMELKVIVLSKVSNTLKVNYCFVFFLLFFFNLRIWYTAFWWFLCSQIQSPLHTIQFCVLSYFLTHRIPLVLPVHRCVAIHCIGNWLGTTPLKKTHSPFYGSSCFVTYIQTLDEKQSWMEKESLQNEVK